VLSSGARGRRLRGGRGTPRKRRPAADTPAFRAVAVEERGACVVGLPAMYVIVLREKSHHQLAEGRHEREEPLSSLIALGGSLRLLSVPAALCCVLVFLAALASVVFRENLVDAELSARQAVLRQEGVHV